MECTVVRNKATKEPVCIIRDGHASIYLMICSIDEAGSNPVDCEYSPVYIDLDAFVFGAFFYVSEFRLDLDTRDQIKGWFIHADEWQDVPDISADDAADAEIHSYSSIF